MTLGLTLALAPALDRSDAPTSSISETAILRGYGASELLGRTERCACGGTITSLAGRGAIAAAVGAHNESSRHAQWSAWREAL